MNNSHNRKGAGHSRGASSAKRSFLPNIAAAGRLEKSRESETSKESARRNSASAKPPGPLKRKWFETPGRDGDVRRNDGGGGKNSNIIRTESTLTFPERLNKREVPHATVSQTNGVKVETIEGVVSVNGSSFKAKVERSPSSFDTNQKNTSAKTDGAFPESSSNGFISDIPKVDRIPIVLPARDGQQFHRFLTKRARRRLEMKSPFFDRMKLDGVEEEGFPALKREAMIYAGNATTSNSKATSHIDRRSVGAGQKLRKMLEESNRQLMLFQLPSSFMSSLTEEDRGQKLVGKLQILRSGRVVIESNRDRSLTVVEAIHTECCEIAASITLKQPETNTNSDAQPTIIEPNRTSSFTVLGDVRHSFLCANLTNSQ